MYVYETLVLVLGVIHKGTVMTLTSRKQLSVGPDVGLYLLPT